MKIAFSSAEIQHRETQLIAEGTPLMARASYAIANRVLLCLKHLRGTAYGSRVLILVGPGDNGSDALIAGTLLRERGVAVSAFFPLRREDDQWSKNFFLSGGVKVEDLDSDVDLILDGVFGLRGRNGFAIDLPDALLVSIDLPSGLAADVADPNSPHVHPDITLALGALKQTHLMQDDSCGEIELIDIGLDMNTTEASCVSYEDFDIALLLPQEDHNSHKYQRGTLEVIAGSHLYPGAADLTVGAALKLGIGMVRLNSPEVAESVLRKFPEVVINSGSSTGLVVGPGRTSISKEEITYIRSQVSSGKPVLLDAAALEIFEHIPREFRHHVILTPHDGEFQKLSGVSKEALISNRLEVARNFVNQTGVILVLKGSRTLIVAPSTPVAINHSGSLTLATAGSGDVLAGVIGTFLAKGVPPREAAILGVHLHGLAGELIEGSASELIPALLQAREQIE